MGLVATWLSGIGLSHAIPSFKAAGIVTPSALAELDLAHYEALGVTEPTDRRKLFYLVQRIKMAVDQEEETSTHQQEVDKVLSQTLTSSTKLVLTDDSLGDGDSAEMVEPPKRESDRRKSGRVTVSSTRQSVTTAATEETKENRRQNSTHISYQWTYSISCSSYPNVLQDEG
jgi:SAM domain (Sterile alpha motif)